MQVDFDTALLDIRGKPIETAPGGPPMTLAYAACEALLALKPTDTGIDKAKCYRLAMAIVNGGTVNLTPEDAALIKAKIGEIYAPIIVGRAFDLLDDRVVGEA